MVNKSRGYWRLTLSLKVKELVETLVLTELRAHGSHVATYDVLVLEKRLLVLFIFHREVFDEIELYRNFGSAEHLLNNA